MTDFEAFWKEYPRKIAKRSALKAWQKLDFIDQTNALQAITQHKAYWLAKETETDFIPHASTWLNQGRWEDELVVEKPKPKALPLNTDKEIELAYQIECGGDPKLSRFNSYFEMKKFILDRREKNARSNITI